MARKPTKPKTPQGVLNFATLVDAVRQVHERCAAQAARAVNVSLTLRNWAIGCYIVEYEQSGADRAEYGERMVDRLAEELRRRGVPASDRQRLYAYVGFYRAYPQIGEAIPPAWAVHGFSAPPTRLTTIVRSLTGQSAETAKAKNIVRSATGISQTSGRMLADRLSYTHLELGHGFCFEARQKSIVIGRTRGFVDLVFYHRILKCHVLIELKVDEFRHEHLGQLNT